MKYEFAHHCFIYFIQIKLNQVFSSLKFLHFEKNERKETCTLT